MIDFLQSMWANKDLVLEVLGAFTVFAWVVAKVTPNTWDNKLVARLQQVLDLLSLSNRAKAAGDKAVTENPPKGIEGISGGPREIN